MGFVSPCGAQATCVEGWNWDSSTRAVQAAPCHSSPRQDFLYRSVRVLPSGVKQSEGPWEEPCFGP